MNTKRVIAVFFQLKFQEIKDSFLLSKEGLFCMFLITFLLSLLIAMHYYQWAMIVAAVLSILVIFSLLVMAVFSFVCWIRDNIREAKRIVEAEERRKSIIDSTND